MRLPPPLKTFTLEAYPSQAVAQRSHALLAMHLLPPEWADREACQIALRAVCKTYPIEDLSAERLRTALSAHVTGLPAENAPSSPEAAFVLEYQIALADREGKQLIWTIALIAIGAAVVWGLLRLVFGP